MRVAGLVTTRQRPGTAKGYVFVLMEDEHGPINVIVKPDVYKRDRTAVRMEPFLAVRGRLQKDGATINVIAHEVEALRVPGAPVRRRGLSRSYAATDRRPDGVSSNRPVTVTDDLPETARAWSGDVEPAGLGASQPRPALAVRDGPDDLGDLHASLPDPLEHWADPEDPAPSPFRYLTALRQSPPGIKSFG